MSDLCLRTSASFFLAEHFSSVTKWKGETVSTTFYIARTKAEEMVCTAFFTSSFIFIFVRGVVKFLAVQALPGPVIERAYFLSHAVHLYFIG